MKVRTINMSQQDLISAIWIRGPLKEVIGHVALVQMFEVHTHT